MTEEERGALNEQTAVAGDGPLVSGDGVQVRRLSLESLGVLERIGHKVVGSVHAAMEGRAVDGVQLGLQDVIELFWVLSEDPDEVLRVAMQCTPAAKAPVSEAALRYVRRFGDDLSVLKRLTAALGGEVLGIRAAAYDAEVPEDLRGKKN